MLSTAKNRTFGRSKPSWNARNTSPKLQLFVKRFVVPRQRPKLTGRPQPCARNLTSTLTAQKKSATCHTGQYARSGWSESTFGLTLRIWMPALDRPKSLPLVQLPIAQNRAPVLPVRVPESTRTVVLAQFFAPSPFFASISRANVFDSSRHTK